MVNLVIQGYVLARACKTLRCIGLFVSNFVDAKLSAIVLTTYEVNINFLLLTLNTD